VTIWNSVTRPKDSLVDIDSIDQVPSMKLRQIVEVIVRIENFRVSLFRKLLKGASIVNDENRKCLLCNMTHPNSRHCIKNHESEFTEFESYMIEKNIGGSIAADGFLFESNPLLGTVIEEAERWPPFNGIVSLVPSPNNRESEDSSTSEDEDSSDSSSHDDDLSIPDSSFEATQSPGSSNQTSDRTSRLRGKRASWIESSSSESSDDSSGDSDN
jgi:hypothetical protein